MLGNWFCKLGKRLCGWVVEKGEKSESSGVPRGGVDSDGSRNWGWLGVVGEIGGDFGGILGVNVGELMMALVMVLVEGRLFQR